MICYYKNNISCGANRRELEDQRVKKLKFDQIVIRPSWSRMRYFSHTHWESKKRREREKKKKKRKTSKKGMDLYG